MDCIFSFFRSPFPAPALTRTSPSQTPHDTRTCPGQHLGWMELSPASCLGQAMSFGFLMSCPLFSGITWWHLKLRYLCCIPWASGSSHFLWKPCSAVSISLLFFVSCHHRFFSDSCLQNLQTRIRWQSLWSCSTSERCSWSPLFSYCILVKGHWTGLWAQQASRWRKTGHQLCPSVSLEPSHLAWKEVLKSQACCRGDRDTTPSTPSQQTVLPGALWLSQWNLVFC